MSELIGQQYIDKKDTPIWKDIFLEREYNYLENVINGLIHFGGKQLNEILIQYGKDENRRIFHIFEPFVTLNYLGFLSPSVVSIVFNKADEIEYLTGNDNGLSIFSKEVTFECIKNFPKNSTLEIDFWHFVDAIGSGYVADFSVYSENGV